jgi:hypothetical protein
MKGMFQILFLLSVIPAFSQTKSLSGHISTDPIQGVKQICHLVVVSEKDKLVGMVLDSRNTQVEGLFDVVNTMAPEIAEESMLKKGDQLDLDNLDLDVLLSEEMVISVNCDGSNCSLISSEFHRLSNYTHGDSLFKTQFYALSPDLKTIEFEFSYRVTSTCEKEELAQELLQKFDWYAQSTSDLTNELRVLASRNNRDELEKILAERQIELLSLTMTEIGCLSLRPLELKIE